MRHPGQALVLTSGAPRGPIYATLVWSLATADLLRGGVLMAAFGTGTLPMLLALGSVADKLLSLTHRPHVRQIGGSVIIGMGLLTLLVSYALFISGPIRSITCSVGQIIYREKSRTESDQSL